MNLGYALQALYSLTVPLLLGLDAGAIIPDNTATGISREIEQCASIKHADLRLACYDTLSGRHHLSTNAVIGKSNLIKESQHVTTNGDTRHTPYIKPSQAFLRSELVVTPWVSEYAINISDFIKLLASAVQDDGNKIVIQGWTRHDDRYVLDITMKSAVKLIFKPSPASDTTTSYSLLESVKSEQGITDASLFVMTIATMAPDE